MSASRWPASASHWPGQSECVCVWYGLHSRKWVSSREALNEDVSATPRWLFLHSVCVCVCVYFKCETCDSVLLYDCVRMTTRAPSREFAHRWIAKCNSCAWNVLSSRAHCSVCSSSSATSDGTRQGLESMRGGVCVTQGMKVVLKVGQSKYTHSLHCKLHCMAF